MNAKQKYINIYFKDILPCLKEFEVLRKETIKKCFKQIIISILTYVLILFICKIILAQYNLSVFICVCSFFFFFYAIFIYPHENKNFSLYIKEKYILKLIKAFDNLTWENLSDERGLNVKNKILNPKKTMEKLRRKIMFCPLFTYYDEIKVDDVFSGMYDGFEYSIYETKLNYLFQEGSKSETLITVFKGVIFIFSASKEAKMPLLVCTKNVMTIRNNIFFMTLPIIIFCTCIVLVYMPLIFSRNFDIFSDWYLFVLLGFFTFFISLFLIVPAYQKYKKRPQININKINLEDVKFDKKYDVFCDDEIESRYLLTPAFMEKLFNLKMAYGAKNIKLYFHLNSVIVALETNKNLFEVASLYKSFKKSNAFVKFYNEIDAALSLVKYFNEDD